MPGPRAAAGGSVEIDCGGAEQPVTVSASLPKTPTFPSDQTSFDLDALQCDFDVFSWNVFLALSHSPSGAFGDRGGDNVTTWQVWPDEGDIFLPNGAQPPEWKAGDPPPPESMPAVCRGVAHGDEPVLAMIGKQPLLEAPLEPFNSGPLIDVHGHYSRFGITVNQPMYQYIWENGLYGQAGQKRFSDSGHAVEFPCGCNGDPTGKSCPEAGQQGAVMVKAAWKVLDVAAGDDPSRFHTVEALVYTPPVGGDPESCERQLVGLVGLHIATKTQTDPQWLWSTFEQVDNVPTRGETPAADQRFNFFQPDCADCNTVNQTPPEPWNPHDQPVEANAGKSQVVRQIPLTAATKQLNAAVQGLLGGTVWQHYELVSTQWPTDASGSAKPAPSAANNWCNPLEPDRRDRRPGARLPGQHDARDLHPGHRAAGLVELHPLPPERHHGGGAEELLRLHLPPRKGELMSDASQDAREPPRAPPTASRWTTSSRCRPCSPASPPTPSLPASTR